VPGSVLIARTCRGREKLDALEIGQWDLAPMTVTAPGLNFYATSRAARNGMSIALV